MRVVIVGASGGIGRSLCQQLADLGGCGFLIGRNEEKLNDLSQRFQWGHAVADATDWASLEQAFERGEQHLGGLDAAINLAGSVLLKPMHLTSLNEWRSTLDTNLTSAAGVIKFAAPRMFGTGGSIVLVSSAAATIGLQNHEAIAAAKGGLEGLVTSAAATYAPKRIRLNAVAPGLVKTPMTSASGTTQRAPSTRWPCTRSGDLESRRKLPAQFCGLRPLRTRGSPAKFSR